HFLHLFGADPRALDGGADRGGAELGRGEGLELALETAHGRASDRDDDDRIRMHSDFLSSKKRGLSLISFGFGKQLAANEPAADLGGAVADLVELGVAPQAPGGRLVDVAHA